jgi:hypothetical protein
MSFLKHWTRTAGIKDMRYEKSTVAFTIVPFHCSFMDEGSLWGVETQIQIAKANKNQVNFKTNTKFIL